MVECADGTLYTGITNDVARRIDAHNRGTAARYTRARLPVVLRYQEPQPDRSHASKREAAIKRLSRAEKNALVTEALRQAQTRAGLRQKKPRSVRSRRKSSSRVKSKLNVVTAPSIG